MENVIQGLYTALAPVSLLTVLIGVFIGLIVGVIPGIGAGVGLALLLPAILNFPPEIGLMLLIALWAADGYGGSISSILINVPGGAGAVPTCFDGYQFSKQGKAGEAIGLAMAASMSGGIMGAAVLMLVALPMANFATKIGPPEYTILALVGLTLIGGFSSESRIRGLISAVIGLMMSFVGYDVITGFVRYNFGSAYLYDGIDLILVVLGVFAISNLVGAGEEGGAISKLGKVSGSVLSGFLQAFKRPFTILRGATTGITLGVLPGIGIALSSFMAYDIERKCSKTPEKFGKGIMEGIIAPESANNAVQPAALIPTLTLGIPGSTTAAVFMGALMIYGIAPGHALFENRGPMVWALMWAIIVASISYVIVGLLFANFFARLTVTPLEYLCPITLVIVFIGSVTITNTFADLITVFFCGVLGYFLKELNYPIPPLLLGVILGPMMSENYFRALLLSGWDYGTFFNSSISIILWIILFLVIFGPSILKLRSSFKKGVAS